MCWFLVGGQEFGAMDNEDVSSFQEESSLLHHRLRLHRTKTGGFFLWFCQHRSMVTTRTMTGMEVQVGSRDVDAYCFPHMFVLWFVVLDDDVSNKHVVLTIRHHFVFSFWWWLFYNYCCRPCRAVILVYVLLLLVFWCDVILVGVFVNLDWCGDVGHDGGLMRSWMRS